MLTHAQIAALWSRYYQGADDPAKEARARRVLQLGTAVNAEAIAAILVASQVHGGDMGVEQDTLIPVLIDTGDMETGYSTKVQNGGGPARSYWQIEPETARDLLLNSAPLFGPKWRARFGVGARRDLLDMSLSDLGACIYEDSELAACFAAAKWITAAHPELSVLAA